MTQLLSGISDDALEPLRTASAVCSPEGMSQRSTGSTLAYSNRAHPGSNQRRRAQPLHVQSIAVPKASRSSFGRDVRGLDDLRPLARLPGNECTELAGAAPTPVPSPPLPPSPPHPQPPRPPACAAHTPAGPRPVHPRIQPRDEGGRRSGRREHAVPAIAHDGRQALLPESRPARESRRVRLCSHSHNPQL